MLNGLRSFYSRPVRRDFLLYAACAAASAFFLAAGLIHLLRYAGAGAFGGLIAAACVPATLLITFRGRAERFALPGWLKFAIPATILASVLIFYLIL